MGGPVSRASRALIHQLTSEKRFLIWPMSVGIQQLQLFVEKLLLLEDFVI